MVRTIFRNINKDEVVSFICSPLSNSPTTMRGMTTRRGNSASRRGCGHIRTAPPLWLAPRGCFLNSFPYVIHFCWGETGTFPCPNDLYRVPTDRKIGDKVFCEFNDFLPLSIPRHPPYHEWERIEREYACNPGQCKPFPYQRCGHGHNAFRGSPRSSSQQ